MNVNDKSFDYLEMPVMPGQTNVIVRSVVAGAESRVPFVQSRESERLTFGDQGGFHEHRKIDFVQSCRLANSRGGSVALETMGADAAGFFHGPFRGTNPSRAELYGVTCVAKFKPRLFFGGVLWDM